MERGISERKRRRGERRNDATIILLGFLGPKRRTEMCSSNWIIEEINSMLCKYMMSTKKRGIGLVCCR